MLWRITFDLEEDLSIGNEEDENYVFYRGAELTVDLAGNIYVLDLGNQRIQVDDTNGVYIRTIGRRGKGPGDFQFPGSLCTDPEGNIYVQDRNWMKIFHGDGKLKHIFSKDFLRPWGLTNEGNILGQMAKWEGEESNEGTYDMVVVDFEGNTVKTIAGFAYKNSPPLRNRFFLLTLFEELLYS